MTHVTTTEAAKRLDLSLSSVYKFMNNGELPFKKDKMLNLIDEEELQKLIDKRNGYGLSVPSSPIYPSMHIINLIKMLDHFYERYEGDHQYALMFRFRDMLYNCFDNVIKANQEGKMTSFTGKRVNGFLQELRKQIERDKENSDIWNFLAHELKRIFENPISLSERNMAYTQLLIDVTVKLSSVKPSFTICLPEEE